MRTVFAVALMLLAASAATAQVTQSQVSTTITTNVPSGSPASLTAASLRAALNQMNTAIFQAQGASGLTLSGTPSAGYVPIATGATAAAWGNLLTSYAGPVNLLNTTVPGSFTTPAFNFNDLGITGFNFSDGSTHFGMAFTGNTPATGTGSYTGFSSTQYGTGRDSTGYVTGSTSLAVATGGSGNYGGGNPYVIVCGTAVLAQCPNGTAATLNSALGEEIDIFSYAGATIFSKQALRIADLGVIQATGVNHLSAAINIIKISTAPGFEYGIHFNDPGIADTGFPLASNASIMSASTSAATVASGIDFSGMAGFTGCGAICVTAGGGTKISFGASGGGGFIRSDTTTLAGEIIFANGATALQFSGSTNTLIVGSDGSVSLGALAGTLKFLSTGMFTANGTVATAMSNLGPTGSHTTIQKWLTITESDGTTVGYIPVF